ncbi:MAG: hypothetical protein HZA48_11610 [Planctomycetes bacterium]|nr:hypothetical protein [Planctomycetota bacterium]
MSRKIIYCALAVLVTLGSMPVMADVTTGNAPSSAKNVKVYGDAQVTGLTMSTSLSQGAAFMGNNLEPDDATPEGAAVAQLHAKLGFEITLGSKCFAVVEFENKLDDAAGNLANFIGNMEYGNTGLGAAYVKAEEFLVNNLSFSVGIMPYATDLRGNNQPFLLSTTQTSLSRTVISDMGGWVATYHSGSNLAVDLLMLKLTETVGNREDMDIYGVHVDYKLASNSDATRRVINVNLLVNNDQSANGQYYTIGGGADYSLNPNLELYGELYFQTGEIADGVDQSALALYFGAKWTANTPLKPYLDASLWYLTGDDATSAENEDFLHLDNVHQALILEDPAFGFDYSTNMLALKFMAGASWDKAILQKPLSLDAFLGWYSLQEDNGGDGTVGLELDIMTSWYASDSLTFSLGLGYLFSSDLLKAVTVDAEDSGSILVFDTALKF